MPVLTANNVVENEMAKFQVLLSSNFLQYTFLFPNRTSHQAFLCSSFFSNLLIALCLCSIEIMIGLAVF